MRPSSPCRWLCLSLLLALAAPVSIAQEAPGSGIPGARQPGALQPGARQPGAEQEPAGAEIEKLSDQVTALLARLDQGVEEMAALDAELKSVPESDREAIGFRRNERASSLLQDLDDIARKAAELPEDEPLRQQLTERLRADFQAVAEQILAGIDDLSGRIAELDEQAGAQSGPQRIALEAYIARLRDMRLNSYEALVNLVDSRQVLGLPVDEVLSELRKKLYLRAETLVGRLRFTQAGLEEMRQRLRDDAQNADLVAAVKRFDTVHSEDIQRLERVTDLMERLDLDVAGYRTVLVQQGHSLSVRDIEGEMVVELLRDGWSNLRAAAVERGPDMAVNLLLFFALLFVFRLLSRLVRRGVRAACERPGVDLSTLLKDMLATISSGAVMVLGILIALSLVGISLGPMLAGLGVAGFIVGFALQDTLGNFASGAMILIYRPYDVDDFVEVAGASGLVKKMSLVSTTITTFDNQTLVVPNSKIWGDVIKNVTAQKVRRVDMQFGISYGDDIDKAERLLTEIVQAHAAVLDVPEPLIKLHTLGDSSVNFIVRPWVRTPDYWPTYWDITRAVKLRFDAEGITIPFPQRDVHVHGAGTAGTGEGAESHA